MGYRHKYKENFRNNIGKIFVAFGIINKFYFYYYYSITYKITCDNYKLFNKYKIDTIYWNNVLLHWFTNISVSVNFIWEIMADRHR